MENWVLKIACKLQRKRKNGGYNIMKPFILPHPDLDVKMNQRLTVVSAPAGFGKTMFVQEWCRRQPFAHVWVTVTEADRDPGRFYSRIEEELSQILAIEPVTENEFALFQGSAALILDDFHILENQNNSEILGRLLKKLPSSVKVVVISRYRFSLDIKAAGQITTEDLRFDQQQSRAFFEESGGQPLSEDEFIALHAWTRGWAAGMRLLSLAVEGYGGIREFTEQFQGSHPYMTDYFTDEVWRREPRWIREILLQTVIIDRFDDSFGSAITDKEEQGWLLDLFSRNLFIASSRPGTFRFEPLFREYLLQQLKKVPVDERRKWYEQISLWYEKHENGTKAIDFALQADDTNRAASLIIRFASDLLKEGEWGRVERWRARLGNVHGEQRSQLLLFYGWVYFLKGAFAGLNELLLEAEEAVQTSRLSEAYKGELALLRSFTAFAIKDVEEAMRQGDNAASLLAGGGIYLRFNIKLNNFEAQMTRGKIGLNGRIRELYRYYSHLFSRRFPVSEMFGGYVRTSYTEILVEFNRLSEARESAERVYRLAQKLREKSILVPAAIVYSRILMAEGKIDDALTLIDEVKRAVKEQDLWKRLIISQEVRLLLHQEKVEAAKHLFYKNVLHAKNAPEPMHEFESLTYARVLIAAGAYEQVGLYLEQLLLAAESDDRFGTRIEILLLESVTFEKTNRIQKGIKALAEAMELAGNQGYVRIFLDEGEPIYELLRHMNPPNSSYAGELLSIFRRKIKLSSHGLLLTSRESEVLRMMEEGCTNKEIAARMNVTVGTVKGYGVTLFKKLGVHNRTQAVARGKELDLIGRYDKNA
jgi:LuxR family maltose regulon positive regulatory protein